MAAAPAHILVFPYPAQGHMLALLDLAHHLSAAGLAITVVVTTANRPLLDPLLTSSPTITPLVLPFPSHPSIPAGIENTKDLPPSLSFTPFMHTLAGLRRPLLLWSRSHPSPPRAIISDIFLGWTLDLAADLGIPRLVFSPSGALEISAFNFLWPNMPRRSDPDDDDCPITLSSLPGSPAYPWRQLPRIFRSYEEGDEVWEFIRGGFLQNVRSWGHVFNTFGEIESRYLDHIKDDVGHDGRVWAVGPLCWPDSAGDGRGGQAVVPAAEVSGWLDRFEEGSVLYVCFGSQAELPVEQALALAEGLERSGVRFVWGMKGGAVPEGFEERVAGRGRVIRGWAPQVAVLGHRAVGWFLTHCGWNSTLEALAAGVAMLNWPRTADQFLNARLLEEEAGVGVRVGEGNDTVPDPNELARIVAEMVGGDRPERMRAAELRKKAAEAVGEGGSSSRDLAALVEALSKLKSKST